MKKYLLPQEGRFYKANLHMHTTISDGEMTPEETKAHYMKNGYSVVAFTDHDIMVRHNQLTDDNFVAINSMETYYNHSEDYYNICFDENACLNHPYSFVDTYHLNFYAKNQEIVSCPAFSEKYVMRDNTRACITEEMRVPELARNYSVECINEIIARANKAGFLVSYNHPVWSGQTYKEYADIEGAFGVEVYNGGNLGGWIEDDHAFEDMIRQGKNVFPLDSDDAHSYKTTCGGWVMLKADKLTYENVIRSLENGDFYASTGPEIYELYVENDKLYITCSPSTKIIVSTERRTVWQKEQGETPITSATFDLSNYVSDCVEMNKRLGLPRRPFLRVRVFNNQGKIAYTRAYFLDEWISIEK